MRLSPLRAAQAHARRAPRSTALQARAAIRLQDGLAAGHVVAVAAGMMSVPRPAMWWRWYGTDPPGPRSPFAFSGLALSGDLAAEANQQFFSQPRWCPRGPDVRSCGSQLFRWPQRHLAARFYLIGPVWRARTRLVGTIVVSVCRSSRSSTSSVCRATSQAEIEQESSDR